jgi:signal transduction histidine kinase
MGIPGRRKLFAAILFFCSQFAFSQSKYLDSLHQLLQGQKEDSNKINLLTAIGTTNLYNNPETALAYAHKALILSTKLQYLPGLMNSGFILSSSYTTLGNYPLAIDYGYKTLTLAKKSRQPLQIIWANAQLAQCYFYLGDYKTSLQFDRNILAVVQKYFPDSAAFVYSDLSKIFERTGHPDSALIYANKCYDQIKKWQYQNWYTVIYPVLGNAYASVKKYDSALYYLRMGIPICTIKENTTDLIDIYNSIANIYYILHNNDSVIHYAKNIVALKTTFSYPNGLLRAAEQLTEIYGSLNEPDSTLKYLRIASGIKDSLFNRDKTIAIQNIAYKEQEKQKAIEDAQLRLKNQFTLYFVIALCAIVLITGYVLFRLRRSKQLQNMRNSIANDLHDDIGSTLSSISILNELAKSKAPGAIPLLNSIGESTVTIQENMNDIVWAVNPGNDAFANVLQRMNQFAFEILDARNVETIIQNDDAVKNIRLTMVQRKNLYLFFKEVINNIAKHANAKKVMIQIHKKHNFLEMIIEDDGKGFNTIEVFHSNGMNTLKKRAIELNAVYTLSSKINSGTQVKLSFKIT